MFWLRWSYCVKLTKNNTVNNLIFWNITKKCNNISNSQVSLFQYNNGIGNYYFMQNDMPFIIIIIVTLFQRKWSHVVFIVQIQCLKYKPQKIYFQCVQIIINIIVYRFFAYYINALLVNYTCIRDIRERYVGSAKIIFIEKGDCGVP